LISMDDPDYERKIFQATVKKNFKAFTDAVMDNCIIAKDAALQGKVMDHTMGRAIEKTDSRAISAVALTINLPGGMMPLGQLPPQPIDLLSESATPSTDSMSPEEVDLLVRSEYPKMITFEDGRTAAIGRDSR